MNKEVFAPMDGDMKGYFISNFGRIIGKRGRILKPRTCHDGYVSLFYKSKNRSKYIRVHHMVAIAFLGFKRGSGLVVNHIDGTRDNNRLDNLEILTQRDNLLHTTRVLGRNIGEKTYQAKLKNKDIPIIREMISKGTKCSEIARIYNVQRTTISSIKNGKSWVHIKNLDKSEEV